MCWCCENSSAYNTGFPGQTMSCEWVVPFVPLNPRRQSRRLDQVSVTRFGSGSKMRFDWTALTKMYTSISYIAFDDAGFPYRFHDFKARLTTQEANSFNQSHKDFLRQGYQYVRTPFVADFCGQQTTTRLSTLPPQGPVEARPMCITSHRGSPSLSAPSPQQPPPDCPSRPHPAPHTTPSDQRDSSSPCRSARPAGHGPVGLRPRRRC